MRRQAQQVLDMINVTELIVADIGILNLRVHVKPQADESNSQNLTIYQVARKWVPPCTSTIA